MKLFLLLIAFLLTYSIELNAQEAFQSCGANVSVLSLSQGEYSESFNNGDIVQIGTVYLNIKTNKIVSFIHENILELNIQPNNSSRWLSIDGFAEKYYEISPYQYALNNPIRYIDINGDSAWSVKREWNESDIKGFGTYAQNKLQQYAANGTKSDCADLGLSLIVGYSSENGLALQFASADGKTTFDSNSDNYNSVDDFLNGTKDAQGNDVPGVLSMSVANGDIQANTFSVAKSDKQAGDMIILDKPVNHVAIFSSNNTLTYGNLDNNNNPTAVKTTQDWSNANRDGQGRSMTYYPDKNHVNRWQTLNIRSTPPQPLKMIPCTGVKSN